MISIISGERVNSLLNKVGVTFLHSLPCPLSSPACAHIQFVRVWSYVLTTADTPTRAQLHLQLQELSGTETDSPCAKAGGCSGDKAPGLEVVGATWQQRQAAGETFCTGPQRQRSTAVQRQPQRLNRPPTDRGGSTAFKDRGGGGMFTFPPIKTDN